MDSFGVVRYKDTVLLTEKILKQPDLQPWGAAPSWALGDGQLLHTHSHLCGSSLEGL